MEGPARRAHHKNDHCIPGGLLKDLLGPSDPSDNPVLEISGGRYQLATVTDSATGAITILVCPISIGVTPVNLGIYARTPLSPRDIRDPVEDVSNAITARGLPSYPPGSANGYGSSSGSSGYASSSYPQQRQRQQQQQQASNLPPRLQHQQPQAPSRSSPQQAQGYSASGGTGNGNNGGAGGSENPRAMAQAAHAPISPSYPASSPPLYQSSPYGSPLSDSSSLSPDSSIPQQQLQQQQPQSRPKSQAQAEPANSNANSSSEASTPTSTSTSSPPSAPTPPPPSSPIQPPQPPPPPSADAKPPDGLNIPGIPGVDKAKQDDLFNIFKIGGSSVLGGGAMFVAIFFITKHCLRRKRGNAKDPDTTDDSSGSPKELEAGLAGLAGGGGLGALGGLMGGLQPPPPAATTGS
ncbi:hypothetical protein QBC35DRAFT_527740 [Podospora australis]|uniref:Uncharacterized protein n=1 Tax=Podospora australis TaxID=1536484 RepID=A0AAN7APM9_9PEZI|nr:hypothetical protein QBC35DRAFT_527740 [Podospora australis]